MSEQWTPKDPSTVYLTTEQLHRLSGLACDALVGMQLHTDASDETYVLVDMVPIDGGPGVTEHYTVHADGSYARTT